MPQSGITGGLQAGGVFVELGRAIGYEGVGSTVSFPSKLDEIDCDSDDNDADVVGGGSATSGDFC